jgi:hypothetical protein
MNTITKLTLAAAAMTAGMAAQTMSAKVPFEFKARGAMNGAGEYTVSKAEVKSPGIYSIRNEATGKRMFLQMGTSLGYAVGRNSLAFDCSPATCEIKEVWFGGHGYGQRTSGPALEARTSRRVEIALSAGK